MSLFSSTQKQSSKSNTAPTNPKPVTDSIIDFTQLISSLGNRDPRQFVTGPSGLQNAAFGMGAGIAGRYGMGVPQGQPSATNTAYGQPQLDRPPNTAASMYGSPGINTSAGVTAQPGGSQGAGLYQQAGVQPEKQYDYQGYLDANPDIMQHYNSQIVTPKNQANLLQTGADYDNNGQVSAEEFARHHYDRHGKAEGRALTQLGGQSGGGQAPQDGGGFQGGQGGFSGQPFASPGVGYSPAQMGQNPNDVYRNATEMAQRAGNAGPSRGNASFANQVDIDPASRARASQGHQFSRPYENRYTDQVVDTTMANFDEFAGRHRAQEAAQAAGNNAFSGSRFGVQRAITEEQIARERASQEAGLRFGAQDRAFGLGMQDAGMATQVSQANAAAANQRAQAQAQMNQQREFANMGAANNMSQFNAGMDETSLMRALSASGQMGQLAGAQSGNERADLSLLSQLGEQERGINQQGATADLQLMQLMAQLYGQTPLGLFSGQNSTQTGTQTSTPSTASILGSGLMAAGGLGWSPLGGAGKAIGGTVTGANKYVGGTFTEGW